MPPRVLLPLLVLLALLALLGLVAAPPVPAARWSAPVDGRVVRPFALGADPYAAGWHRGIDVAVPSGGVVRAACSGRVTFAGSVGRTGLVVSVRCGRYVASHVGLGAVRVRRGAAVLGGGVVGVAGASGSVHLGARLAATGAYVDPSLLLGGDPGVPSPPVVVAPRGLGRGPSGPSPPAVRAVRWAPVRGPAAVGGVRPVRVPVVVWVGLGLVAGAVPVGGVVSRRRRRRRGAMAVALRSGGPFGADRTSGS